ncbi:hypothetical protein ACB092_04G038200 [Castanea dentata]
MSGGAGGRVGVPQGSSNKFMCCVTKQTSSQSQSLTSLSVSSVFFLLLSLAFINYRGFCLPNSNQSTTIPWLL